MPVELSPVRVALVEDDPRLCRELTSSFSACEGLLLVGTARSRAAAAALFASDLALDVALVDLGLPDGSGIDVIDALTSARPEVAALAFTVTDDKDTVLACIAAGARGYLLKDAPIDTLHAHVREAARGGAPLSPEVARHLVDAMRAQKASGFVELTPRENEVARLLADGRSYAEAAGALSVGLGTVQTHVKAIYGKLGVARQSELVALAFRKGLVR